MKKKLEEIAEDIGKLGTEAKEAVTEGIEKLKTDKGRSVAEGLGRLTGEAKEAVAGGLGRLRTSERGRTVAEGFGKLTTDAKEAVAEGMEKLRADGGKSVNAGLEKLRTDAGRVVTEGMGKLKTDTAKLRAEAIGLMEERERKRMWSGLERIPTGHAPDTVVPGCLVLEGGSFRGVYTSGVLDVLMENGINLQTVIGTSAGALNGYNYIAGEIGRSARINLGYRHDLRYFGPRSAAKSHGVVGFSFILDEIEGELPFDHGRFDRTDRRFLVTVTNCAAGEVQYCEKGVTPDFVKAVQASASMPFVSEPVEVDGMPCLDGGLTVKIPYRWALENGFEKVLVVRTRPAWYRRSPEKKRLKDLGEMLYRNYPELPKLLMQQSKRYNAACDELDALDREGRIMMLCPSGSIQTSSLEGDMERLGGLYLLGRRDTEYMLPAIRRYLGTEEKL